MVPFWEHLKRDILRIDPRAFPSVETNQVTNRKNAPYERIKPHRMSGAIAVKTTGTGRSR